MDFNRTEARVLFALLHTTPQAICHSLFKRPEVQEVAECLRFENDMVRAEAVCDTLAKPLTDVEKVHLRRVFHRAFGIHPRGTLLYPRGT